MQDSLTETDQARDAANSVDDAGWETYTCEHCRTDLVTVGPVDHGWCFDIEEGHWFCNPCAREMAASDLLLLADTGETFAQVREDRDRLKAENERFEATYSPVDGEAQQLEQPGLSPEVLKFAEAIQAKVDFMPVVGDSGIYAELGAAADEARSLEKGLSKWGEAYAPENVLDETANIAARAFRAAKAGGGL